MPSKSGATSANPPVSIASLGDGGGRIRSLERVGRLVAFTGGASRPLDPAMVWRIERRALAKIRRGLEEYR